jgi:hypothetical protein|tara:strand:+ start:1247 stop:1705 length:459 start_codon:yes stop_codon:yes gene_type:complete
MAHLRTVEIDYEGMGDRYFNRQQKIMENLRDTISTVEYDPTEVGPNGQGSIFGEGATYYNNGNEVKHFINQEKLADSYSLSRTGSIGPSVYDMYRNTDSYRGIKLSTPVTARNAFNYKAVKGNAPVSRETADYKPNDLLLVTDSRTKARNPF